MDVLVIFTTWMEGGLRVRDAWFKNTSLVAESGSVPFSEAASRILRSEQCAPVIVMDADRIAIRRFSEKVTKEMRVRGSDIWLMTWVEDTDDLFDAFNTNAEMVMGPLHAVVSRDDLEDIVSVSDSFVPVVFTGGGGGDGGDRRRRSWIHDALGRLADAQLYHPCVLDMDGSITNDGWGLILDGFQLVIPFTRRVLAPGHPRGIWITPLPPEN